MVEVIALIFELSYLNLIKKVYEIIGLLIKKFFIISILLGKKMT